MADLLILAGALSIPGTLILLLAKPREIARLLGYGLPEDAGTAA